MIFLPAIRIFSLDSSILQLHDLLASDTHFLSRLKHSVSHSLGIIVGLLGLPHSVLRFGSGSWHDDLSSTLRSVLAFAGSATIHEILVVLGEGDMGRGLQAQNKRLDIIKDVVNLGVGSQEGSLRLGLQGSIGIGNLLLHFLLQFCALLFGNSHLSHFLNRLLFEFLLLLLGVLADMSLRILLGVHFLLLLEPSQGGLGRRLVLAFLCLLANLLGLQASLLFLDDHQ